MKYMHEKCPNMDFFLVCIFPHSDWIRRDTKDLSVFSPNAGKYGPGKTPYLETFHTVQMTRILFKFMIYPSCERVLKNGRVKLKMFRESFLNFTFGQGIRLCLAKLKQSRIVQISIIFDIEIFNNNIAFYVAGSWSRWWVLFVACHD